MYDMTKIQPIINHLKSISSYYKESNNEVIIFCSYCDDSTRQKADHGHLYISKTAPVFNCFRCSNSGNLIRLLIDTGFDDEDVLKYLGTFIKYKTVKDYYGIKKKVTKLRQIKDHIINLNINFEQKQPEKYKLYKNYLIQRLGLVEFSNFLISPTFFNNKLSCLFTNSIGEDVVLRLIESYKDYRYHLNEQTSGKYYFQEKNFEKYSQIVLAEGPFDIINLYLYNNLFKNCFFISLNGKKYNSVIENLILEDFLIGDLEIDLVFDNDVNNYKTYLYRAKLLTKHYNQNIIIKGFKPLVGKDVGDYPAVQEI
ncbi:MAG TPA: hypothetical protein PLL26_02745 [Candidatus Dojkabacteria bacterium]|nr:hypothetical protein [Candidatus Dojkabacteria bacterium]